MSTKKRAEQPSPQPGAFPGGRAAPEPGELRVAVDRKPYAEIIGHAVLEPEVEVCGVLVGSLEQDQHGPWVHVRHAIRGQAARQEGAAVTFTHETWNHIHQEMDRHFPDDRIVGWYHTHGGFGVFLSEMDTFVHQNFFPEPHHLAYVYDPLAGSEGFFVRRGGRLEPIRRYWLGGRERRPATRQPDAEAGPRPAGAGPGGAAAAAGPGAAEGGAGAAAALERVAAALQWSATRERSSDGLLAGSWIPWVVAGLAVLLYLFGPRLQGGGEAAAPPAGPLLVVDQDPSTGQVVAIPVEVAQGYGATAVMDARGNLRQALALRTEGGSLVGQLQSFARLQAELRAELQRRAEASAAERASLLRILWIAAAALAGVAALGATAWFVVLRRR